VERAGEEGDGPLVGGERTGEEHRRWRRETMRCGKAPAGTTTTGKTTRRTRTKHPFQRKRVQKKRGGGSAKMNLLFAGKLKKKNAEGNIRRTA